MWDVAALWCCFNGLCCLLGAALWLDPQQPGSLVAPTLLTARTVLASTQQTQVGLCNLCSSSLGLCIVSTPALDISEASLMCFHYVGCEG